jgi:hypothetical protein
MRVKRHLVAAGLGASIVWLSHPTDGARRRRAARAALHRIDSVVKGRAMSTGTHRGDADPPPPPTPATLMEVVEAAKARGIGAEFAVAGSHIRCGACGEESPPETLNRDWVHRLEGTSDPDELLTVSALTCSACGARGLLILPYGPAADEAEADVARRLPEPANADMAPLETLRVAV